jgi:hypothetical protein
MFLGEGDQEIENGGEGESLTYISSAFRTPGIQCVISTCFTRLVSSLEQEYVEQTLCCRWNLGTSSPSPF